VNRDEYKTSLKPQYRIQVKTLRGAYQELTIVTFIPGVYEDLIEAYAAREANKRVDRDMSEFNILVLFSGDYGYL
jgi:RIO-like serine/threonine protein kinase